MYLYLYWHWAHTQILVDFPITLDFPLAPEAQILMIISRIDSTLIFCVPAKDECSNNVVIKVNLCLSCCASNKFQSFRYLKILLLSIYYYSLFLWANVSARYKHHAWSLKCSENANELDLSTRASLKHGMVYKTRKNSGGML